MARRRGEEPMPADDLLRLVDGIEPFSARARIAAVHGVSKLELLQLETIARHPMLFLDEPLKPERN